MHGWSLHLHCGLISLIKEFYNTFIKYTNIKRIDTKIIVSHGPMSYRPFCTFSFLEMNDLIIFIFSTENEEEHNRVGNLCFRSFTNVTFWISLFFSYDVSDGEILTAYFLMFTIFTMFYHKKFYFF